MGLAGAIAQCALDFLVPERCHACGASLDDGRSASTHALAAPVEVVAVGPLRLASRLLCAACAAQIRRWHHPVLLPPGLAVHPAFVTDERLLAIIHLLKFGRRRRIAPWLARAILPTVPEQVWRSPAQDGLVVPVPLDGASRRRRGFNQAEAIARELASRWRLECRPGALAKVRRTAPQSALGRAQRMRNLDGAFVGHPPAVRGRRILLVDDLVTTGATIRACADALRRSGAGEVVVVCAGYRDEAGPAAGTFLQS